MLLDNTAIDSTNSMAGKERSAAQPARAWRRQLIAERVHARRQASAAGRAEVPVPANDQVRVAFIERQLRIEIEARLEQLRMALWLQQIESGSQRGHRVPMLLATMLSAGQLLERHRLRPGSTGVSDALYYLECQVDALYLAAAELCDRALSG